MSRQKLGVAVTTLFTIASVLVPGIDERYRVPAFIISVVLLIACCIWYWLSPKNGNETNVVNVLAKQVGGHVTTAGRDVHQNIYQGMSRDEGTPQPRSKGDELKPLSTNREKELFGILYKIRDLIVEEGVKPGNPDPIDAFGALVRYAGELNSEQEVEWICAALKQFGNIDPLELLDKTSNGALRGRRANFLHEARASNYPMRRLLHGQAFAKMQWAHKDRYNKGRAAYAETVQSEEI